MLRVWSVSGEEVSAVPVESLTTVRALKQHLQGACGVPRFRQRLLHNGAGLEDASELQSPLDLQLVLLGWLEPSGAIMDAVETDDMYALEECLQRPEDPDQSDVDGFDRPILQACRYSSWHATAVDMVRLLLEAGSCANKAAMERGGPLWEAARHGSAEIVRMLLEARANIDQPDVHISDGEDDEYDRYELESTGRTPLYMACLQGHVHVARLLLDAGAQRDQSDRSCKTPLWVASRGGHMEIVRLLLQSSADKDRSNRNRTTPLWVAAKHGHSEVARLLLQADASKDQANRSGRTPFNIACTCNRIGVARLLLAAQADANLENQNGRTALWEASSRGHLDIVRLLLEAG